MAFSSLKQLVATLSAGVPGARAELRSACWEPALRIVNEVEVRYGLDEDETPERLAHRLVSWFAAHLIALPESDIARLEPSDEYDSQNGPYGRLVEYFLITAFRHFLHGPAVLFKDRKSSLLRRSPQGGVPSEDRVAFSLSGQPVVTRWLRMPLKIVSGDFADHAQVGDTLWIVLGDATGHGWLAYAVIDGVASLWKAMLNDTPNASPRALCEQLDRQLEACLPESMFVEAILAQFKPDGTGSASPAGFCRVITRRNGNSNVELEKIGNLYLGMGISERDEKEINLALGDEILLASDGVHEQTVGDGSLDDSLIDQLAESGPSGTLHDALVLILRDTFVREEQEDDITAVTIQYVEESDV